MTRRHFTVPGHRASRTLPRGRPGLLLQGVLPLALGLCLCLAALSPPAMAGDAGGTGPLREVLAAEFAVSAGRLDEAVGWYLQAAKAAPDDASLAARATRYALMGRDDGALGQALALWRERAPESVAMQAAGATLALRTGKTRAARRQLEA